MHVRWMFVTFWLAVLVAGCRRPLTDSARAVDVIVEGNKAFPEDIAGGWRADQHGWEFVFAPDGQLLSAVISLGRVRVIPGQTTTLPTKSGDQAVFTPGRWTVHYLPDTSELTVKIAMDHVRIEMAGDILEGTSTDVFSGPIRPTDGVWQVQWTSFTRYKARTPTNISFDLSTRSEDGETLPLTFTKAANQ
jgi:hypothetical protein